MNKSSDGQQALLGTIRALIEFAEAQDKHFAGYTKAVGDLAGQLATVLSLSEQSKQKLRMAALLHDLGRIGLRQEVLNKNGPLSPAEEEHLRSHVALGGKALAHVIDDEETLAMIRHHHEWYDGRGYPDRLSGEAIPLGARLLAVADAFVAMTQTRPHRPAKGADQALQEIRQGAGKQFCPRGVEALVKVMESPQAEARGATGSGLESGLQAVQDAASATSPGNLTKAKPAVGEALERRIRSVVELRALPDIVADVMAMTSDPQAYDFSKLVAKIECDHALSTKILRLANSALYATANKVESIDRAIVKIGADGIRQLVLGAVIIDHWKGSQETRQVHRDAFWQHTMATALVASHLAASTGCCDEQAAFTAGLLHDLGQLILQEALGKDYGCILEEARLPGRYLPAVEAKRLGTDHASIMRSVGRDWGLPRQLCEVLTLHHQPWKQVQLAAPDILPLLLCVRIGNAYAHALGLGDTRLGSLEAVPKLLAHLLGVQQNPLSDILPHIATKVSELAKVHGFASTVADQGLADRKRPQRPGFYVSEDGLELDPVWCYLGAQTVAAKAIPGLDAWLSSPESSWCWVRASTPAFVRKIILSLESASLTTSKVGRGDLLLLLPEAAQGGLQGELSRVGLPCLVEPWSTAALGDALTRMRAARPETALASASPRSSPRGV